jgi:hypothetical protein
MNRESSVTSEDAPTQVFEFVSGQLQNGFGDTMDTDILNKFLDQGLLDLGEDPKRFEDLKGAAADVAKALRENVRLLSNGSSVLLGGELDDTEPVLELCKNAIANKWPTYRSRFPSNTTQLFRATLLQAVARITEEDPDCSGSAIVFYATVGLLPYIAAGREDSVFREFLLGLGERVESEASRHWSVTGSELSTFEYSSATPDVPAINIKTLKQALKNAAGASGEEGANPEGPGSNSAAWLEHYGQGAATAISKAVGSVIGDLIPKIVEQGRTDIDEAMGSMLAGGVADNLRADVLYWKAALFSPAKGISYREMSPDSAVYWTAYDLHMRVPKFHPQSLEFFLGETLRAAIGDDAAKERLTLEQFGAALTSEAEAIGVTAEIDARHRLTPLEAVQASATNQIDAHAASVETGIPSETTIAREELAVLLFRGFQVLRLVGGE